MAVVHVGTGTKVSGTSTPDDWTASNVYPIASWVAALGAGAETVIIDTGTFEGNSLSLNGAPADITIKTRANGTTLQTADGSTPIFSHTSGTAHNITLDGFVFDASPATWTGTGNAIIQITQNCPSITLNNCAWVNVTATSAARTVPLLLRYLPSISGAAGAVTMTNCTIFGIDGDFSGDFDNLFLIQDNGANSVANTFTVDGLTLVDVDIRCSAGDNFGLINHANGGAVSIKNVVMRNIFMGGVTGSGVAGLFRQQGTPGVATISDVTVDGFTMDGLASSESIIKIIGTATVSRITVNELRRTNTASGGGNSIGGVVSSQGNSADLTYEDVVLTNSGGFFGTAFYNSGGGSIVARRIYAHNITDDGQVGATGDPVNGIAFYSGGAGDATWEWCIASNCTGAATNGVAAYAHLAATGSTSKVFTARNVSIVNSTSTPTQPAMAIRALLVSETLDATLTNVLFDNGPNELDAGEQTGTLNLTLENCAIAPHQVTQDISAGVYSFTNETQMPPRVGTDGRTLVGSLMAGKGKIWTTAPVGDVDGNPVVAPFPIGGNFIHRSGNAGLSF